jgi:hypothetical protein
VKLAKCLMKRLDNELVTVQGKKAHSSEHWCMENHENSHQRCFAIRSLRGQTAVNNFGPSNGKDFEFWGHRPRYWTALLSSEYNKLDLHSEDKPVDAVHVRATRHLEISMHRAAQTPLDTCAYALFLAILSCKSNFTDYTSEINRHTTVASQDRGVESLSPIW